MKCYADSSFLTQFLIPDFATPEAISLHRRLGRPVWIYASAHDLEIPNALRTRIFTAATGGSKARAAAKREAEAGLRRLSFLINQGLFQRTAIDWDAAIAGAEQLSVTHTERLGTRAIDILHVAIGILLKTDLFVTCDERQGRLAKAAGLQVELVAAAV